MSLKSDFPSTQKAITELVCAVATDSKHACQREVLDRVRTILMEADANPFLSVETRTGVLAACRMMLMLGNQLYDLPADLVRQLEDVPEIAAPMGL